MTLQEILQSHSQVHVIDPAIGEDDFVAIDLSEANEEISVELTADAAGFSKYMADYLERNGAKAAFGGYNERRVLYQRSVFFQSDFGPDRDVHIALDIWTDEGTSVHAALDGVVHGFDYNAGAGNYGPTIILKHLVNNCEFHTLYGHLSLEDIEDMEVGHEFKKGEIIGHLGNFGVNGDYPPHLHFQIIKDIGMSFGDYPGVCSREECELYLKNCPDPNLLLKLKQKQHQS